MIKIKYYNLFSGRILYKNLEVRLKPKIKINLPLFRPKWQIVVFRKSPFPPDISKSTKSITVKFYKISVYHYKAFTCKI